MLLTVDNDTAALQKFDRVQFDQADHIYTVNGQIYTSATTFLGKYKAPFDRLGISARVARREGLSQRMVLDQWSIKRDQSTTSGSEFHLYAELWLNYGRKLTPLFTPHIEERIKQFHKFLEVHGPYYTIIATELIVADDEWKVAGCVDLLARRNDTGDYVLFDWKTNEEIEYENPYPNSKMRHPLSHLDSCNYYQYCLQLALYRAIIQRNTGLPIKSTYIAHFPAQEPFSLLETYDMNNELNLILPGA